MGIMKMKGVFLSANWEPKSDYILTEYELKTQKAINSNSIWRYPKLELIDLPVPVPKDDEVVIKVRSCGICGSDLHYVEQDEDGYILYPGHTKLNIVIGHEFSGEIVKLGAGVKGLTIGDAVCVEEMFWCGECTNCKNGYPNQCGQLEEIGVTQNGGMAEYVSVPAKLCWNINEFKKVFEDEQTVFDVGALIEPCSVVYNAIFDRGQGINPGAYTVVFGGGPIGLASIALLRAAGAAFVLLVEPKLERREVALAMGADLAIDPGNLAKEGTTLKEYIDQITGNRGADVLVDAAGGPSIIPSMFDIMAVGAKIIPIAMTGEQSQLNLTQFQSKAGQIVGALGHSGSGNFEHVIRLIASRRIDLTPLIGDKFHINEVIQAFEVAKKRNTSKVMFNF